MNKKQRSILAGRKPKHLDDKPTLDAASKMISRGASPLLALLKWLDVLEAIDKAQMNYFMQGALTRLKKQHPACKISWEDVQPAEPMTLMWLPVTIEPLSFSPDKMEFIKAQDTTGAVSEGKCE